MKRVHVVEVDADPYGRMLLDGLRGRPVVETLEREDGYLYTSPEEAQLRFAPFEEWPRYERDAMAYAKGRVLDVGCGAGRGSLYLQDSGLQVVGIDASPLAVQVARERGVRDVRVMSARQVSPAMGRFDTILLLGNNFGLLASAHGGRSLLRRFLSVGTPEASLIVAATSPYLGHDPHESAYQERNRARRRMPGQMRLRVRYTYFTGQWFDWLFVSKDEALELVRGAGWEVTTVVEGPPPNFILILRRQ